MRCHVSIEVTLRYPMGLEPAMGRRWWRGKLQCVSAADQVVEQV